MEINNKEVLYILIYIILPIILLSGLTKDKNKDILDRDTTSILKGFLVIYVAIHHYVQRISNPNLLNPLNYVGFLCVSFFFLMSGYGLTLSFYKKENLKGFFKKRFLRLYFPFVICNILVAILENISIKSGYSILRIFITSFTLRTIYSNTILWYIFVQILMYIVFFISFKIFKSKNYRIVFVGLSIVIYIIISIYTEQGAWRYNTVSCFFIGIVVASYKEKIINIIDKYYVYLSIICILGFMSSWYLVINGIYSYYITFICSIIFVLLLIIFTYKCKLVSALYGYLGSISYEIYIIQLPMIDIVISLMKNNNLGLFIILLNTIILSIISNKISNLINKVIN